MPRLEAHRQLVTPVLFALSAAVAAWVVPVAGGAESTINLSPKHKAGDVTRVAIQLEAGGHNLVRDPAVEKGGEGDTRKLPMSVVAELQYDERLLTASPQAKAAARKPLAVRHYLQAEATIKVDQGGVESRLPGDRRLIVVEQAAERPILVSPAGPLARKQLDLIDVIGNSFAVDRLLPGKLVAEGESWNHEAEVMAALLVLDSTAFCEVQSVLDEFNNQFAKIRIAGTVHGTIDGAATQHDVRGVYLFDQRIGRVVRMNIAVREKRSIGDATPGLEGVAKLQMTIEPSKSSEHLTNEVVASLARLDGPPRQTLLQEAAQLGFRLEHDRQWYVTNQGRESITLRRVNSSGLVAQCTLTSLPSKSEGRQTTLEQFQKDVTYALGKNFGELVSARQWKNKQGHYCFEVVTRGKVEQLPVEWHYYLVAQESGHRVSLAFTVEGTMVDHLEGADRALVEAIELIPISRQSPQNAVRPVEPSKK